MSKEILCNSYCMCIGSKTLTDKILKNVSDKLEEERKHPAKKTKRKTIRKPNRSTRISIVEHAVEKGKQGIIFRISPRIKPLSYDSLITDFKLFQDITDYVGKQKVSEVDMSSCIEYVFDMSSYRFSGGMSLPTNIALNSEIISRIGKPKLSGIILALEKSPLGVKNIELDTHDNKAFVTVKSDIGTVKIKEHDVARSYEHSKEIALLFLEE